MVWFMVYRHHFSYIMTVSFIGEKKRPATSKLAHIGCTDQVHLAAGGDLLSLVVIDFGCIYNCTYN